MPAAFLLATAVVNAEPSGSAPPPAATGTAPAQTPSQTGTVRLLLHGDPLPAELLLSKLEQELRATVTAEPIERGARGTLTITFHRTTHELVVSWDSPGEGTVTRAVTARDRDEDAVEDAVLLAGNLASQEADDIAGPRAAAIPPPVAPTPPPVSPPPTPEPEERLPASASFFYPLATDPGRRHATSALDFNLIYGRIGGIDGFQLGLVNIVGPDRGRGVGTVKGLEIAGLVNIVAREAQEFQFAGGINSVGGNVEGVELAALANLASGSLHGAELAAVNRAGGDLQGAQIGLVNVAGDVSGFQLGLVNVARNVRGVTIGLVNIADDVDGLPIAPISVTKSGGKHPVVWSGTSGFADAGVKFATRHTYTSFFGAYHRDYHRDFGGGGLVIGGRIDIGSGFHADIDVSGTYLIAPEETVDGQNRAYHEQLVSRLKSRDRLA